MKPSELAAVIMSLRASRGWSQGELAKRSGLSRNCISLIEAESERANSTISTLQSIFNAFDLDIKFEFRSKSAPNQRVQPDRAQSHKSVKKSSASRSRKSLGG